MKDTLLSFAEWVKEKTSSPLYFTYLFFLIVWNWKLVHILFFESPILFKNPRVEYVSSFLEFHISIQGDWSFFSYPLGWLLTTLWHILPPVIFTYLSVVYLPRLYFWAYSIHLKSYFARKNLYEQENAEHEKEKTRRLREVASQREQQKVQTQKIARSQTQEERWIVELDSLESSAPFRIAIKMAYEAVYRMNGHFSTNVNRQTHEAHINPGSLSLLDTLGLIEIHSDRRTIEFTEKGKFYLKELQLKNKLDMF